MKKHSLIILILILLSSNLFSQEKIKKDNENFNELKLNGLMLILGAIEVSYERTLNQESSVGLDVLINLDNELEYLNYYVSPYYRLYFGKKYKYAAGFFIEGFAMLNSYDTYPYNDDLYYYDYNNLIETKEKIDFALGLGLGGKWLTESGFIGEINVGVGRNFLNDNINFDIAGKFGINVGYRF